MSIATVKAIINGQTITLTYNPTSKKYEATVTAPTVTSYNVNAGHYYPVSITATDDAGNSTTKTDADATLGGSLKLRVLEKVKPISSITYPTSNARIITDKPIITWMVTDEANGSGINPATIGITINSGTVITSGITKTAISNGYNCSYTPTTALPNGSNTIKVDASDFDGNTAIQKSVTFIVDTVAPTLSVTAPNDALITNQTSVTVLGVTNDATSSPVTVKIQLGGVDQGAIEVNPSTGAFSKVLTLTEGANTILVTATDAAGKATSITRTVTLNTVPPVISAITLTPNPVDAGNTYIIAVTVTDA